MEAIQIIVVVMVVTILATITLAVVSYAAFRVRERRAPDAAAVQVDRPVFFERVRFKPVEAAAQE